MRSWASSVASVVLLLLGPALAGCLGNSGGTDPAGAPEAGSDDATIQRTGAPGGETPLSARPHSHDYYWGENSELTLLETTVPIMVWHNHLFDEPPREQHTHGCEETLASTSQGGSVKFSLPRDQIVPPGAGLLEATFRWDAPTLMGLRFLYRPPNEHDFVNAGPVVNGEVLRLPLTPEMADAGHATRTQWAFFLCAESSQPVDLAQGDVDVTLVVHHAAEVPLEPAHPDHWDGATTILLAKQDWSGEAVSALNKGDDAWISVALPHGTVVPPSTGTVWANVTFSSTGPESTVDPGTVLLYYRDSTVAEWVYRIAQPVSSGAGRLEFAISLDEDMSDGVYAHESNWDFWLRVVSETQQTAPSGLGHWGAPHHFSGGLSATLTATQERR